MVTETRVMGATMDSIGDGVIGGDVLLLCCFYGCFVVVGLWFSGGGVFVLVWFSGGCGVGVVLV